ncbi:MAG: hypothetical protein Q9160_003746 [Pyrenula sp. 1 TL-2023]
MAEAVGASSAVITLASTAYKSCQTLHDAVDGFRSAHHQILALSSDLEAFYLILGTLQTVLQDEISSAAAVDQVMSDGLSRALKDSIDIFKKITTVIESFKAPKHISPPGNWLRAQWIFKEKTMLDLRQELMECKMTLNIAICVVNEYNLRAVRTTTNKIHSDVNVVTAAATRIEAEMAEHLRELQSKLPAILRQQEDVLTLGLPAPEDHSQEDRTNIRTDIRFSMRRFIDSAAASLSSNRTPPTPSFQVSSFDVTSSTEASTYYTAPSRQGDVTKSCPVSGSTQVFVRNAGSSKTLVFQVALESTVEQLKHEVRSRISLPVSEFNFVHLGRLIPPRESGMTLKEHGVTKDDTFTCISFLPGPLSKLHPQPAPPAVKVIAKRLDGKTQDLHVSPGASIYAVKCDYASRAGKASRDESKTLLDPHDIDLVYKGTVLDNELCISNSQFAANGEDLVLHVLTSPDAKWQPPTVYQARRKYSHLVLDKVPKLKGPFGIPCVPPRRLYYGPFRVSFRQDHKSRQ